MGSHVDSINKNTIKPRSAYILYNVLSFGNIIVVWPQFVQCSLLLLFLSVVLFQPYVNYPISICELDSHINQSVRQTNLTWFFHFWQLPSLQAFSMSFQPMLNQVFIDKQCFFQPQFTICNKHQNNNIGLLYKSVVGNFVKNFGNLKFPMEIVTIIMVGVQYSAPIVLLWLDCDFFANSFQQEL